MAIPEFNQAELISEFPPGSVERGEQYQKHGYVIKMHIQPATGKILSSVAGSSNRVYQTDITIAREKDGLDIVGHCSCPMIFNCKHVAATLIEYIKKNPLEKSTIKKISHNTQQWLDQINQTSKPPSKHKKPEEKFVIYILNKGAYNPENFSTELSVTAIVTKKLKSGFPSQSGKNIRKVYQYSDEYNYFSAEDKLICALINNSNSYNYHQSKDNIEIDKEYGDELLNRIINTGRCYFDNTKKNPLKFNKPQRVELTWAEDEEGYFITPKVNEKFLPIFFVNNTAWAYDSAQEAFSKVIYDGDFNLLRACTYSPIISPGEVEHVNQLIRKEKKLPIPTIQSNPIIEKKIIPSAELNINYEQRYHTDYINLDLFFNYAGLVVDWEDERKIIYQKNQTNTFEIPRDIALEEKYLNKISDLKFKFQRTYYFHHDNKTSIFRHIAPKKFIEEIYPELKKAKFNIKFDDDFPTEHLVESIDAWYTDISQGENQWFDLELGITVKNKKINLLPILQQLIHQMPSDYETYLDKAKELKCSLPDGQVVILPADRIKKILNTVVDLFDKERFPNDNLQLSMADLTRLDSIDQALEDCTVEQLDSVSARKLAKKLTNFKKIKSIKIPKELKADLRAYQKEGVNWLQFLREYQFGGVLADDMGLGKTLQAISHICIEKKAKRLTKPCLVIAPTSLVSNWENELEKFAPHLSKLILHGDNRKINFDQIKKHDVVISTYPLLVKDEKILLKENFHLVILDEAQIIKNPKTKAAKIARELSTNYRICLTGTPLENHLGELWSLFHFVMPGLLGNHNKFTQLYRTPIEKHNSQDKKNILLKRIAPFIIRRSKDEVAKELPAKTEIIKTINLSEKESDLYETIRLAMHEKVTKEIASKGFARSQIIILDALLKLRQVCCDARLLKLDATKNFSEASSKLTWLSDNLPNLIEEGRKIILFSQFTKMLDLIEKEVKHLNIDYVKLTGQTKDRKTPITKFQSGNASLFLISLKAGGTGLNLTAADTVIHFDPWWNPAVEAQATDRAHRIGQDKPVFVYKLIAQNSIEEKILIMQKKKAALLDTVLSTNSTKKAKLTNQDVEALFANE